MTHHYEVELKAHPAEARRARTCARQQIAEWGLHDLIETAELLVGELVGNAVVHTATPARLRLTYTGVPDPVLRLEVSDTSVDAPRLAYAGPDDVAGRGLELVSLFSDRWDWDSDLAGKTVWCELCASTAAVS